MTMRSIGTAFARRALLLGCMYFVASGVNAANLPHIGYVYPAGGEQGTTFEVSVGGQRLEKADSVTVTGNGVNAKVLEYIEPEWKRLMREKNMIKKEAADGSKTNAPDVAIPAEAGTTNASSPGPTALMRNPASNVSVARKPASPEEMAKRKKDSMKQKNSQIDETLRLSIKVSADAEPGERELRILTPAGASNPLFFHVGTLPETMESTNPVVTTNILPELPIVINGQIMPGEADLYRFKAAKGEHLVFTAQARALVPYMADAVPGWCQAVLILRNAAGKEVAFVDDYRFEPDPVLFYKVPDEGEYTLEIRDALYRGREDFVYRITAGAVPFLENIFPLGGPLGRKTTVALTGVNLPTDHLDIDTGRDPAKVRSVFVKKGKLRSNAIPFAVDSLPEVLETEPDNTVQTAQHVSLPIIINGRIQKSGDVDVFRFKGKAGDTVVAEVQARHLMSPLDSFLKLTDEKGTVLASNDDLVDKENGLNTHHADSWLSYTIRTSGVFFVHLRDTQQKGGSDYAYRLRISPPRPDFVLRVVPSSINIPQGGSTPITVYALRKDSFQGAIHLSLAGIPDGFSLNPDTIPEKEEQVRITLSAKRGHPPGYKYPTLQGTAQVNGHTLTRTAVPAEDMMQAFFYRHLVPTSELVALITKGSAMLLSVDLLEDETVRIPAGGTATLTVRTPAGAGFMKGLKLVLDDPPKGITMDESNLAAGAHLATITLHADDEVVMPGLKGTLILSGIMGNGRTVCTAPAIPFEITLTESAKDKGK